MPTKYQIAPFHAAPTFAQNGPLHSVWHIGWSWGISPNNNHWTLGPDGQPGKAGVDDDNNNVIDQRDDVFELGFPGSDDIDLDADDVALPDSLEPGTVEEDAQKFKTSPENAYWQQDWGSPGKQHRTNYKYND